tara:strand:- start:2542 stop:2826 length:285 start_codon:yes stop_codon:yes gene_type:complete
MELEDIFKVDLTKAKVIALLEIERYRLDVKGGETCLNEEAAILFGVVAGMAYSEIESKVCNEQESKYSEEYVDFLEQIVKMEIANQKNTNIPLN